MIKRISLGLGILMIFLFAMFAMKVSAAGSTKLSCFNGRDTGDYGGYCLLWNNESQALLDNTDGNVNGDMAGVYMENPLIGESLSSVSHLGYNFRGYRPPDFGNLSLNIPIDTDGNWATTETTAIIDAYYCSKNGTVNVIQNNDCGIWADGLFYANWESLISSHPSWKISGESPYIKAFRFWTEPNLVWIVNSIKFNS